MASLPAGTLLGKGRYRVVKELNRGGTAVVYEGVDLTSGNIVALKVMGIKDGKATVPVKGVKREIEYASSVQHENVVKLVDFVVDERQIVIVWELILGCDLLDLLNERGGRLEETMAANYFAQLLRGVTFIHSHGLCHRDLKPENCMVERATNRLKIIDFGLSKHQQSAVTLGVGTPDYMAPELLGAAAGGFTSLQERRVGQYDARACDVWAMGVLLYLLVTGQYPFEDPRQPQNVVATLQNIAAGKMRPMPKRVTPECVQLIGAMLTQDPAKRITLQGIAQHPWLKIMGFAAMVDTMPEAETAAGAEAQLTTAPAPASQVPETKANEVEQRTTVPSRPQSFSFPEPAQPPIQGKATPVTPSMVALHATAGPASSAHPFGSSHPQAVSPPLSEPTPSRESSIGGKDRVAQVPSGGNGAAQKAEQAKRTKLGSFCKMWFGAGTGKTA